MQRYFIIYKPYQVLSQFTSEGGKKSLADVFDVPKDVYPVGRLDYDSEGLLILTNDTQLNHLLLSPTHKHEREYWVQVEGAVTPQALNELRSGVTISIDGKLHKTLPCKAASFDQPPHVFERHPSIRFRKEIPVSWLSLSLVEGKNRQVRRMTAKVGFPTLRLIRYRIEAITIQGLEPGAIKELTKQEMYKNLFI
ncbi:pseudouridine synthase [Segetibacter sp.]|jgi:23S rRNA pseudouridine2457 synthase|uniref:pseudouridine synthase n=1 Tax=Segetibacter sp. TaxID=2231182 RepID=UPI00260663D7|nr:pseudouridine synthase [Segetibacter sp.]MCW3082502.1 pseudouridine synthase [Segetibacter sp.]